MAIRPAMLPIIDKVREMIGDPASATMQFSQQQIQDALDESRFDVRYELLVAAPTVTRTTGPTAEFVWILYLSQFQYWEADTAITQWGDFTQRTPVKVEFITGQWQFSYLIPDGQMVPDSDFPGQYPPIFVTGRSYDIYAASVKMLQLLKAKLMLTTFNFSAQGQSFQAEGIFATVNELISEYSRHIKPRMIALERTDAEHPYIIEAPVILSGMNDRLP